MYDLVTLWWLLGQHDKGRKLSVAKEGKLVSCDNNSITVAVEKH